MKESKVGCKVHGFPGLLHLHEHRYDDACTFWFGAANLECTSEQSDAVFNKHDVHVELDDGRVGAAAVLGADVVEHVMTRQGIRPAPSRKFYLAGITALAVPPST